MIIAGIGSRTTPAPIQAKMADMFEWFAQQGFMMRSGGANGADKACEEGWDRIPDAARGVKEIYTAEKPLEAWWIACAEHFHPNWPACTEYARKLHARNTPIVLGPNENLAHKSDAVVCWTKNGKDHGGTGQGIRIANHFQIPVFNLFDATAEEKLWAFLQERAK